MYAMLKLYAEANCKPTSKSSSWGEGFRNRREVIDKALAHLGLSPKELGHGVVREVLCAPLAANAAAFLSGEKGALEPFPDTAEQLAAFWRERWLLPRAAKERRHRSFVPQSWELWDHEPKHRGRPPKPRGEPSQNPAPHAIG
jgi:hypothetical protein